MSQSVDTRGRGRVGMPRGVRQTAFPSQSPVRRGRGRSPCSEDVHSQASPSSRDSSRDPSCEERGGILGSDDSFCPHRDRRRRHRDDRGAQSHGLFHLEQSRSPHTAVSLKDSRVNFRLGSERLQAKVDYRSPPSATQSADPSDGPSFTGLCSGMKHLKLGVPCNSDQAKPPTIEYSSKELKSARTQLVMFTKHSRENMVRHGKWEVCTHPPTQSVLPSQCWQIHKARTSLECPSLNPW